MGILDVGGHEVNPMVDSVIKIYGDKFWVWKFGIVSFCVILLCLHSMFRFVKPLTYGITVIYIIILFYQIILFYLIL